MNKQDYAIAAVLVLMLLFWGPISRTLFPTPPPPPPPPPTLAPQQRTAIGEEAPERAETPAAETPRYDVAGETMPFATRSLPAEARVEFVTLTNEHVSIALSPYGASVVSVTLLQYPAMQDQTSPVRLDFEEAPALQITGESADWLGMSRRFDIVSVSPTSAVFRTQREGATYERRIELGADYEARIVDTFSNSTDNVAIMPARGLALGSMSEEAGVEESDAGPSLGLDALTADDRHTVLRKSVSDLAQRFHAETERLFGSSPSKTQAVPRVSDSFADEIVWLAARNKFFTQILDVGDGAARGHAMARRASDLSGGVVIERIHGVLALPEQPVRANQSIVSTHAYYVGPKKYALLNAMGDRKAQVMDFGFFGPICVVLLHMLNLFDGLFGNYGVAILLLTLVVRVVFWPITHKSTQSMRKMQELKPEVDAIRKQHKDKPQKMNEEMMALYRKHKVNPLAGCLPMLIQIPVFFALFQMLRSAIELRLAGFLWIQDLSSAERIIEFPFTVPLIGWDALNILPFVMAGTMVWQQNLTPSMQDAQQQKIMMILPVLMLFMLYSMPSALMLYWSFSQSLSIVQLYRQKRQRAGAGAKR